MTIALERLRDDFQRTQTSIETLEAGIDSRDEKVATELERADLDALYAHVKELEPQITEEFARHSSLAAISDVIARTTPASSPARTAAVTAGVEEMTPGEYTYAFMRAHSSSDGRRPEAVDVERWERIERTLQHQGTADNLGIIPVPIVGDLIKFVDANRPAVVSSRRLPMPAKGKTFTRPCATQSTQVDAQAAEGDVLASRKFLITGDTVTKGTYGGVLNISEQDIDDSEPALLDLAVTDLAEQYAIQTDDVTATAIETAATASAATSLSLTAPSETFVLALATAALVAYGTGKALPDTLYAAVDRWAYLISLTDDVGRPLFPNIGPANALGSGSLTTFDSGVMGLRLVVDPNFTAGFFSVAASKFVETYENLKGLATLQAPSILETQIAYRGRFAANVYTQGFGALEA